MIPTNLIYTWFGRKKKPESFYKYLESWKKMNPGFNIIEINENNFNVNLCKFTQKAYLREKWAFVSDVARLWAVNKFGGIYLDVDVEVLKPVSKLLEYNQFWAKEDVGQVNSGLIFGSEPNNLHLENILSIYKELSFPEDDLLYSVSTVQIISKYFRKIGLSYGKKRDYLRNNVVVFEPKIFAPLHYWGGGKIKKESMTVHHYAASWIEGTHGRLSAILRYCIHEMTYNFPVFSLLNRGLTKIYKKHKIKVGN
ncbi:glycosyltransferase family 32 protein [Paucilactobacillus kaifaensis]|uniref:glycosyltransferase family 32 protein n=1 Tax=Paucilactobacillus kaifaensis TaxID=2559921 RepID=UPI001CC6CE69|nr:glycosyltransferase [Paucilactobacillus kaifaensis]